MENIENRSKSHNPGANIVILPGREEKRTKETENWSKQFNQMRAAQQRKLAEDNEKMKVVQNRLLALVGGNGATGDDNDEIVILQISLQRMEQLHHSVL